MPDAIGLSKEAAAALGIEYHPGWGGVFTTREAEGAWPNGTRIRLVGGETLPNGTMGRVLGSIATPPGAPLPPDLADAKFFYFVEFDPMPRVPVGCADLKLEALIE